MKHPNAQWLYYIQLQYGLNIECYHQFFSHVSELVFSISKKLRVPTEVKYIAINVFDQ